jgi:hypothetical protein
MQVGDLLKGIHNGELFLIKEKVEIKRHLSNDVYLETVQGFRLAPLRFFNQTFTVSLDQIPDRFELITPDIGDNNGEKTN